MNPKILKSELKEIAYKTKAPTPHFDQDLQPIENPSKSPQSEEDFTESSDSTKKMFHQMQIKPSAPRPKSALKIDKPQEQEVSTDKPLQEVEETKDEEMQGERKFNPTPLSTSYDPYKK
ncbi:MAG: hypothetical protein P4L79_15225 [Legionella sp.]|uniref:hypothetical protein n=1 Tax=Legionella sp. TaxID=459 RepID=UPI0028446FEC|nr:hypothetical protein [Legionella sp.]